MSRSRTRQRTAVIPPRVLRMMVLQDMVYGAEAPLKLVCGVKQTCPQAPGYGVIPTRVMAVESTADPTAVWAPVYGAAPMKERVHMAKATLALVCGVDPEPAGRGTLKVTSKLQAISMSPARAMSPLTQGMLF